MKSILLTTIAAVVLVGCGESPDYSGMYTSKMRSLGHVHLQLKSDGSLIGSVSRRARNDKSEDWFGNWKVEGDFLICEATRETNEKLVFKFNKESPNKLFSITESDKDVLMQNIPKHSNILKFQKN